MSATQRFIRALFGDLGTRTAIPDLTQGDGSLSYQQGYGPDYARQKTDPLAKNIERDKMNQLYYDLTLNQQQYQLNGTPEFTPAADNGGVAVTYGAGARVTYNGATWVSRVAGNNVVPGTDATKWAVAREFVPRIAAAGTVDALTATFAPSLTVLQDGDLVAVQAAGANTSTTPTLNANGLGAKTIVKGSNATLVAGDIPGADSWLLFSYDSSLDKWVLLNPAFGVNALGVGQTWQNMVGSRAIATTYTNTTGRPIAVYAAVVATVASSTVAASWTQNGVPVGSNSLVAGTSPSGTTIQAFTIVPPGATYQLTVTQGSIVQWGELR